MKLRRLRLKKLNKKRVAEKERKKADRRRRLPLWKPERAKSKLFTG
jgi:hypothetical protein